MSVDSEFQPGGMIVGGEAIAAEDGGEFEVVDPATAKPISKVPRGRSAEIDRAVHAAREAQEAWMGSAPAERARVLNGVADIIRRSSETLARIETADTGKPLAQAETDVQVAARYFEFYAGMADKLLGTTIPLGGEFLDYTTREPLGVSGQIVPWNYPLQIGSRGIAPALAAGNTVVVKPAEEASLSLLELGRLVLEAGVPGGVVNVVTGRGEEAGAPLAAHAGIDQLTFTGSVEVGTKVMQAAARNIVPVTMELGGKCPNVVFSDADLEMAIPTLKNALIQNAGQTCSAATRLIVDREIQSLVVERLAQQFEAVSIGPGIENPGMGPLISGRQLRRVESMVSDARDAGAVVVTGGASADASEQYGGYFYQPTILQGVSPDMEIAREEVFGPVLVVLEFDDEDEALALANATDYGLVAGVWTRDISRAHRVARQTAAGQVFINGYGAAGGAELPFGGVRKSGFGREKGTEGINSYLQTKNVCVVL